MSIAHAVECMMGDSRSMHESRMRQRRAGRESTGTCVCTYLRPAMVSMSEDGTISCCIRREGACWAKNNDVALI